MSKSQELLDIKNDLLVYDEAFTTEGMIETLDVAVPYLQRVLEDDKLCVSMLKAIIGDPDSAQKITKSLDKYLTREYSSKDDD